MTSYENSLLAISSITRSTGTLVKRLVTSKYHMKFNLRIKFVFFSFV